MQVKDTGQTTRRKRREADRKKKKKKSVVIATVLNHVILVPARITGSSRITNLRPAWPT